MNNGNFIEVINKKIIAGDVVMPPADKAILQRAIIIASIAIGETIITNVELHDDVISAINCFRQMGVEINIFKDNLTICGVGLNGLKVDKPINFGNSATLARLLLGFLSTYNDIIVCDGENNLRNRSFETLLSILKQIGIVIESLTFNKLPFVIKPSVMLPFVVNDVKKSAQIKSSLLLSALNIKGRCVINEEHQSRDHTEKLLQYFGASIEVRNNEIIVYGGKELRSHNVDIPGDPSGAAFFVLLALLKINSTLHIKNILYDKIRCKYIEIIQQAGGGLLVNNLKSSSPYQVADITINYSNKFKTLLLSADDYPSLVDEYIILAVVAAFAQGKSIFYGIEQLENKESNRIASIIYILNSINIEHFYEAGTLVIYGGKPFVNEEVIRVNSFDDHRVQMCMVIIAIIFNKNIVVENINIVNKSFCNFYKKLESLQLIKSDFLSYK